MTKIGSFWNCARSCAERCVNFIEGHGDLFITLFTFVLALSTVGLWLSTEKLWKAGEQQIQLTSEAVNAAQSSATLSFTSLVASQRAWIAPVNIGIDPIQLNKSIAARITISNVGHEPAHYYIEHTETLFTKVEWQGPHWRDYINPAQTACMGNKANGLTALFPSVQRTVAYSTNVSADTAVIEGIKIVAFTGCITYMSFEKVGHSSFCFFYDSHVTADFAHLSVCALGNRAN